MTGFASEKQLLKPKKLRICSISMAFTIFFRILIDIITIIIMTSTKLVTSTHGTMAMSVTNFFYLT